MVVTREGLGTEWPFTAKFDKATRPFPKTKGAISKG